MQSTPFSWRCPFCYQNATITDSDFQVLQHLLHLKNAIGDNLGATTEFTVCPNPDCKRITLTARMFVAVRSTGGFGPRVSGPPAISWPLIPTSTARVFPDYVPAPIREDYTESCLVQDLSPKASATLARRALQGMIRDFWGVSKNRLKDEIEAIEDKVDPLTWKAIDAVRTVGNIGAHMEKDINLIVDVEPEEASKLIGLVELLVDDWYIARHERQQRLEAIVTMADDKQDERRNESRGPRAEEG